MIKVAFLYAHISLALENTVPFLCPILYAIVDYPPPDHWFTTFGLENAYDDGKNEASQ